MRAQDPRPLQTMHWIRRHARRVREQFDLKVRWPADTGPLEQKAAQLRAMLVNRKAGFRNQERTDLLLGLIALHLNGVDDRRRYLRLVREHVSALSGRLPRHNLINGAQRLH